MKFSIKNGVNICSIGLSDIGSYIRFNYPLTVVWYDNRGSIGQYFCTLPYNEDYRTSVRDKINDSLQNDFSNNVEGLYEILKPLLPIFKNGDYSLNFYSNMEKEFFKYQSSLDDFSTMHYSALSVVFAQEATDVKKVEDVKNNHKLYLKNNKEEVAYFSSILENTTSGIYDGWDSFFATQPFENIDQERVEYFEEIIRNGERPFALLFNACLQSHDYDSPYFILDGHHKLLAYKNLDIYPPLAVITHLPKDSKETEFDAEKLSEVLYPWQIEHILKHWDGKDDYLEEVLKNENSNLHSIVKNGKFKEYYDNRKLKHEAFYNNDKIDGCAKYWYENGQLKSEHFYDKGVRVGIWKDYYISGRLQFIQPYNNEGRIHGKMISYFENGQTRIVQELENGAHKDGATYKVWFENGDIDSELTFRNGGMITRKNWNSWGEFVNHEAYSDETKKLEKVEIPSSDKYDYNSKNYKKRQDEIKDIIEEKKGLNRLTQYERRYFWNLLRRFFK